MTTELPSPAMSVVVFAEADRGSTPGSPPCSAVPSGEEIARRAAAFVKAKSPYPLGGGLGYLTLVLADFDRLWAGVDAGDVYGTAGAVLRFLGPSARQFIGRDEDFTFGWIGDDQNPYGRVLLLQIIPRPHLLVHRN